MLRAVTVTSRDGLIPWYVHTERFISARPVLLCMLPIGTAFSEPKVYGVIRTAENIRAICGYFDGMVLA